jgi:soluble lytic murein transglycosylase-like protein
MRNLLKSLMGALIALAALPAGAGGQQYEPLSDSVRGALSRAIADQAVSKLEFSVPADGYRWLLEMSQRLAPRIPDTEYRVELLKTIHYEAKRAGLDPQLVLGIIWVESGFKKYAISPVGARGLMQVMPFWTRVIGTPHDNLFHLRTNLRYGCIVLRHYLDIEKGDVYRALGRYNGSLGRPEYPNMVLSAWRVTFRWEGPLALWSEADTFAAASRVDWHPV